MIKRHIKFEFIDKFYGMIFLIMSYFPGTIIIGDVEYFEPFVIYLNGLGLMIKEDIFYLKKERFPKIQEIIDKLIALSIVYKSSINLKAAQKHFFKNNNSIYE